jgi:phage gp29-like protein
LIRDAIQRERFSLAGAIQRERFSLAGAIQRWLGVDKQAPPPVDRAFVESELGVTGTPVLGGFLRDLGEYNATLSGLSAYRVYEEMRRSDAQVAATLLAVKLPIRGADWQIVPPPDPTPVEEEAVELVKECLWECVDFKKALENALLMLDFGSSAHEDVYQVDGNRVRLRKLAPRLPQTFYRWIVNDLGELQALEQQGYRAGQYLTVQVPATKLSLFVHQQEGDNFAGRSMLRPAYKHWYMLQALEKIAAIAAERNGLGVPVVVMGPNPKAEDRKTAIDWLQKLSTHEKAALVLPPEWSFKLEGVTGTTRDPKDLILHHKVQISLAALAQFMMLGQSQTGNRALGESLGDFFMLSLQATAENIAGVFNATTIRRIVTLNFGEQVRPPRLVAAQVLALKLEAIVSALQRLAGAGAVQPDEDLEAWLRQKLGAPERKPQPQGPTLNASGTPADERRFRGSERRAARGYERYLALDEIVSELDRGRDEIAAAMRKARSRIQAEVVSRLAAAPIRELHRVSVAPDTRLIAGIEKVLDDVAQFGRGQVSQERRRQRAGKAPAEAPDLRFTGAAKRNPLGVYADATVSKFVNNLTARAANIVADQKRRAAGDDEITRGEIIRRTEDLLDEQSDKWVDGIAAEAANEAFADGRQAGYEQYADDIAEVQYSAILDANVCEPCQQADGRTAKTPDEIPDVPNPDCLGGAKCRCVHVYVFADEAREDRRAA